MKLYPYDLPPDSHPFAWTLYGFGLDSKKANQLARHLFNDLGARLNIPETIDLRTISWAIDWALDPGGRKVASVGDAYDSGETGTSVSIVEGALPPGIRIHPHTGRIAGNFTQPGLYQVTIRLGPKLKYDPLGGPGGTDTAGKWIPIDQPRYTPPPTPEPTRTLADMTPQELEELILKAREAQRAGLIQAAEGGGSGGS